MKHLFTLPIILYFFAVAHAQDNLKFESITTDDGLVSNYAHYLLADSYGYLWIGTRDGLNKFDGTEFELYTQTEDKDGLSNGYISYLYEDWDKQIWIGTMDGLNTYNREENRIYEFKFPNNEKVYEVTSVLQVNDSIVWIGTMNGLWKYNKKTRITSPFQNVKRKNYLNDSMITCVFYDRSLRDLWIGTRNGGFYRMKDGEEHPKRFNEFAKRDFPSLRIRRVDKDIKGNLWIATFDEGVVKLNPETNKLWCYNAENSGLGNDFVFDINCLNNGQVWATAVNGYANLFNEETNQFVSFIPDETNPYSMKGQSVVCMIQDNNQNLWFATHGKGVELVNKKSLSFKYKTMKKNDHHFLNHGIVTNFFEYEDELWICTDGGGLNICNNELTSPFTYIMEANGLGSNFVYDIELGPDSLLYVAAWQGGVSIINPKTKKVVGTLRGKEKNGILSNDITRAICITDTLLWIGTHGLGLNIYDIKNKKLITNESPNNRFFDLKVPAWTNSIDQDSKGRLWFSTPHGLLLYDWNKLTIFTNDETTEKSLFSEYVNSIYEDSKNKIWVSTELGVGTFNEEDQSFTFKSSEWELPYNAKSFLEDVNGDYWVSTTNGLYRVNQKTNIAEIYTKKQGLLSDFYFANSSINLSNGMIAFGGTDGFNYFNPDNVVAQHITKTVSLQSLFLDGLEAEPKTHPKILKTVLEFSDTIILPPQYSEFQIHYSLVYPGNNKTIRYAVRLKGFNSTWRRIGSKTDISYTNLDPGSYTFEVTTYTADLGLSKNIKALTIIIMPPWWATWWFKLIAFIFVVSSIFSIVYWRIQSIKTQNKILEQKVQTRTEDLKAANEMLASQKDEIAAQNTILVDQNEYIKEQNHTLTEKSEEIAAQRNALEELNKTKDKFFSIISHDLKNPLSAMMGFAELLDNSFDKFPEEKKRKFISIISSSSKSLYALLENLLHWARSQSGTMLFRPARIKINGLISENIITLKHNAKKKLIDLVFEETAEFYATVDENMLSTVIRNIASNAIKFTPKGGMVTFSLKQIAESIQIKVEDTGVGMTPEQQEKLFVIEKSKSTTGTDSETGTGLGLILCKEFIDKHNGKIWAETKQGKGSSFYIELPINQD